MKISYDSFWSKIYKFTTGSTNEGINTDFFYYWFIVILGLILLPITSMSKVIEYIIPKLEWNLSFRLFTGIIIWSTISCIGLIIYTADMFGHIILVWNILFIIFLLLGFLYLVLIKFPFIGLYILHILYIVFKNIGKLFNIKPVLEFDKEEVFIIFDISKFNTELERTSYQEQIDNYDYSTIQSKYLIHVVIPVKDCNIDEYSPDNYLVYKGLRYASQIVKGDKYNRDGVD
jgi:hypothetical protein